VYWAVVTGGPEGESGTVDAPLLKTNKPGAWRMMIDPAGQQARTAWRLLGRGGGRAWLELMPQTGRTHQVRVHCAHLGCPLVGDAIYGAGGGERLHLLARAIMLPMSEPVSAEAAPPGHMREALRALGWTG
jgi:23S rRNA-/tRNA-specific pseudouridylate synthase